MGKAGPILAIAANTFREAVRNKVLASLLFFAVTLATMSSLLGQMSLHQEQRVTIDFSLFFSTIFAVIIAIYSMITLLHTETERRTIYTILTKPIGRWQFYLGKYLGVLLLMVVVVLAMLLVAGGVLIAQGDTVTATFVAAFGTLALQLILVVAITALFSTFSSPLLAGMFSAAVFIIGNLISQIGAIKSILAANMPLMNTLIDGIILILPNLEALNISGLAARGEVVPLSYLGAAAAYAATYSGVTLLLGIASFSRKDFQ